MFPAAFDNFVRNFIYPHECAYAEGHDGDMNYVITENVPNDDGGLTKYGIDAASHPNVDVNSLNADSAELVYWQDFVSSGSIMLPGNLAFAHYDEVVNKGAGAENHILQVALGVEADGVLGPETLLEAWNQFEKAPNIILEAIAAARILLYKKIVIAKPKDQEFEAGWLNRVQDLKTFLKIT